jgi:lipoprotein signal peptidase
MPESAQIWISVAAILLHHYTERLFNAHFGIAVYVLPVIYDFYRQRNVNPPRRDHILFALHFLKIYPTENVGASFCRCDEKTWRKIVKSILISLDSVLPNVSLMQN